MIFNELSDQCRFEILRISIRRFEPRHHQAIVVSQLPDVTAAPMADGVTSAVSTVFVESLLETSTSRSAGACLADVNDVGTSDPCCIEYFGQH